MAMFGVMTDNKSVKMQVEERSKELIRQLFKKLKGFTTLEDGFDPKAYLTARANAEIDFEKQQKTTTVKEKAKVILPKDLAHPELYLRLSEWRQAVCEEREVPAYTIAHNRTLLEIAALLPTEKKSMLRINGVGPKRFDDFGLAMIEIVREYLEKREEAETDLFSVAKADTRQVSLDLFREGKTIEEIAKLRELVSSTITTHLTHWVKEGDLPVSAVVDQKLVDTLLPYMKAHPELSLNDYHKHFKGAYDYGVLKLVRTQV
jgi:ribonuclease D